MPVTIREILDKLSSEDRNALTYAFESGISHFVKLPNERYVGVNVHTLKILKPESVVGRWSTGVVKG